MQAKLWFLGMTLCLMQQYNCVKFYQNIPNSFRVIERTRFVTDRQTARGETICLPTMTWGGGGGKGKDINKYVMTVDLHLYKQFSVKMRLSAYTKNLVKFVYSKISACQKDHTRNRMIQWAVKTKSRMVI